MKITWLSLYHLVLALWTGGIALFTFVITPVIFKTFPRDLAGDVVGRLFPGYFLYTLILTVAAIVLFLIAVGIAPGRRLSLSLLIGAVMISLFVVFWVHPAAVAAKKNIASFERESPDSAARKRFSRLHALSSSLNLLLLVDGIALFLLASRLKK
jgi:hypothetical protein